MESHIIDPEFHVGILRPDYIALHLAVLTFLGNMPRILEWLEVTRMAFFKCSNGLNIAGIQSRIYIMWSRGLGRRHSWLWRGDSEGVWQHSYFDSLKIIEMVNQRYEKGCYLISTEMSWMDSRVFLSTRSTPRLPLPSFVVVVNKTATPNLFRA